MSVLHSCSQAQGKAGDDPIRNLLRLLPFGPDRVSRRTARHQPATHYAQNWLICKPISILFSIKFWTDIYQFFTLCALE